MAQSKTTQQTPATLPPLPIVVKRAARMQPKKAVPQAKPATRAAAKPAQPKTINATILVAIAAAAAGFSKAIDEKEAVAAIVQGIVMALFIVGLLLWWELKIAGFLFIGFLRILGWVVKQAEAQRRMIRGW